MRRRQVAALALSLAALLTGCAQEEPVSHGPTRSPGEAAWYASSAEKRRDYCAAYEAHDPQQPVEVPARMSDQTDTDFADDFYDVLKRRC